MRPMECDPAERFNAFISIGGVGEVHLNDSVKLMDRKLGEERVSPPHVTLRAGGRLAVSFFTSMSGPVP